MQACYCGCLPLLPPRLAYPELIPAELHPRYFYTDTDDLVGRLAAAITNIAQTRRHSLRPIAAQFDWQALAPRYDAALAALG